MAWTKRNNRLARPTRTRAVFRRGGQFTFRTRNKIIRTVQRTQPVQYKTFSEPPNIANDKPIRRWIRVILAAQAATLTQANIVTKDGADYSSGTRFVGYKVLTYRFWGPIQGPALTVTVAATNFDSEGNPSTYTDYGDGCKRPCVAIKMPVSSISFGPGATAAIAQFAAGTCEFVDVEFEGC